MKTVQEGGQFSWGKFNFLLDSTPQKSKRGSGPPVDVDKTSVEFSVRKRIEEVVAEFASHSADFGTLERLKSRLERPGSLPFRVALRGDAKYDICHTQ